MLLQQLGRSRVPIKFNELGEHLTPKLLAAIVAVELKLFGGQPPDKNSIATEKRRNENIRISHTDDALNFVLDVYLEEGCTFFRRILVINGQVTILSDDVNVAN